MSSLKAELLQATQQAARARTEATETQDAALEAEVRAETAAQETAALKVSIE